MCPFKKMPHKFQQPIIELDSYSSPLFLTDQLLSRAEVKEEHINSSNLLHLEAILHICEHAPSVAAVQQGFCYLPEGTGSLSQSVLVDVIAYEGGTWVRVFARNRKAIHQKLLG